MVSFLEWRGCGQQANRRTRRCRSSAGQAAPDHYICRGQWEPADSIRSFCVLPFWMNWLTLSTGCVQMTYLTLKFEIYLTFDIDVIDVDIIDIIDHSDDKTLYLHHVYMHIICECDMPDARCQQSICILVLVHPYIHIHIMAYSYNVVYCLLSLQHSTNPVLARTAHRKHAPWINLARALAH